MKKSPLRNNLDHPVTDQLIHDDERKTVSSHRHKQKTKNLNTRAFLESNNPIVYLMCGGLIMGGVFLWYTEKIDNQSLGQLVDRPMSFTKIDPIEPIELLQTALAQVATYFECGCGNCNDHELVSCECPTAKSQRDYIQTHLDEGKSVDEVRLLVDEEFGFSKSQYTDWFHAMRNQTN